MQNKIDQSIRDEEAVVSPFQLVSKEMLETRQQDMTGQIPVESPFAEAFIIEEEVDEYVDEGYEEPINELVDEFGEEDYFADAAYGTAPGVSDALELEDEAADFYLAEEEDDPEAVEQEWEDEEPAGPDDFAPEADQEMAEDDWQQEAPVEWEAQQPDDYIENLLTSPTEKADFRILFTEADPPGKTIYINADLGIAGTDNITGIFVPKSFQASDHFELIMYLHGFKYDTSKGPKVCYKGICPSTNIDNYWKNAMFPLREALNGAGRNAILVAPTLGYKSNAGNLILERGLDLFLNRVLRALVCEKSIAPCHTIGKIILAAHSGGGAPMLRIALHPDKYARLVRECWCFDALYGGTKYWVRWINADPDRKFYSYYLGNTPATISEAIKRESKRLPPNAFKRADIRDHWDLVLPYWKERITAIQADKEFKEYRQNFSAEVDGDYRGVADEVITGRIEYQAAPGVTPVSSPSCDLAIAIPEFATSQKQKIELILLTPLKSKNAIKWNKAYLTKIKIDPLHILMDLERYVDLASVKKAINAHNAANPSGFIDAGVAPIDAVFVEAIHQFQKKIYFDEKKIDGKAGPGTLHSLGIISFAQNNLFVNDHAKGELKNLNIKVPINGKECNYTNWFQYTLNPSFIGITFNRSVHYLLIKQLRIAESYLLNLPRFKGDSLVDMAVKLGLDKKTETHKGGRYDGTAMHIYGLAVDIDHGGNPWIGAGWIKGHLESRRSLEVLQKASGVKLPGKTIFAYLDHIGITKGADTRAAYNELKQRNDEFIDYLRTNPAELKFWQRSATFGSRDPLKGFLNLDADLVYALREKANLGWGAIDFGPGASGDIMHFDMRTLGVGRKINLGKRPRPGYDPIDKAHPYKPPEEEAKELLEQTEDDGAYEGLLDRELDPLLVELTEKIFAREASFVEHQVAKRWTTCFSAGDIAKVQKVYEENVSAAGSNEDDRCSCIVMLNVALGQLLPLRLKQHPARSKRNGVPVKARPVEMGNLTTETIEKAMKQLRGKGFAGPPREMNFFDQRGRTAGTLKPERLKASVQDKVLALSRTEGCWYAYALSVMDGFHSVLLLVDHTAADARIYWLDQFSTGVDDDVTTSLDQRLTDRTLDWWQAVKDTKGKGYDTTIRLWQLRKPRK
jgi:hypothetical protein